LWFFSYPQQRLLFKTDGQTVPAQLVGRTGEYVKFVRLSDHTTVVLPLANLSADSQALVRRLPLNLTTVYPVAMDLTDSSGRIINVLVLDRTEDWIKYQFPGSPVVHYFPIAGLSSASQDFIHGFPASANFSFPLDYVLSDKDGRDMLTTIEGRSKKFVKFTLLGDYSEQCYPISTLSATDQAFVTSLPVNLESVLPVDRVLTDLDGRMIEARIVSIADDSVQFTLLADGSTHVFPLPKLSAPDQTYLTLLGAENAPSPDAAAPATPATPAAPPATAAPAPPSVEPPPPPTLEQDNIHDLRQQIAALKADIQTLSQQKAALAKTDPEYDDVDSKIKLDQLQIKQLRLQLKSLGVTGDS
jgi:hypothetical protein